MFNYDEANFVCENFRTFLQNGISFNGFCLDIHDTDSLDDFLRDHNGPLGLIKRIVDNSFSLSCGFSYDDGSIFATAGYPWNNGIRNIIIGYHNGDCEFSDVQRYFELMNQHLPRLIDAIASKNMESCGSEKFKLACKDYLDYVAKILSGILRHNQIESWTMEPATYRNQRITGVFNFANEITYAQKRKIMSVLDYTLINKYKGIMPDIKTITRISGLGLAFKDNGRKAAPAKTFMIYVKPNNWEALGLDESAQFMPRIGMKRHQSLSI